MKNSETSYAGIIKTICNEENLEYESFSDDWIFKIKKYKEMKYIYGYRFELNKSSTDLICSDKSATSAILKSHNIPCVPHHFFFAPENIRYLNKDGNWKELMELFEKYNKKVVCKPNDGTGGNNVFLITNQIDLEIAVNKIFSSARSMALSPYCNIKNEYRVVILDDEVKLIYGKKLLSVIGNGKSNILKLITDAKEKYKRNDIDLNLDFYYIPKENEIINLNWKHNLGTGANAEIIEVNMLYKELSMLAMSVIKALNIRLASIDIIEDDEGLKVLEVNSGVMLESFSKVNKKYYSIAKNIYKEAIMKMFNN